MLRLKDLAQEKRQITVKEELTEIEVTVAREDFPLQKAQIKISYFPSSAQEAWGKFLSDVTKALRLDFIHSVVDRGDKAPIFRIIMLKNNSEYLVRQRENSSVLEVLNQGVSPMEISWEVTRDILHVKKDLEFNLRTNPNTQQRVFNLVSKPITSLRQKQFTERLLQTTKPKDIVDDVNKLYLPGVETWSPEYTSGLVTLNYGDTARLDADYDMVTIHRLSLEHLDRLCARGFEALVAKQAIHYVFKAMKELADESDVVAVGLKLVADLSRFLLKQRDGVFTAVLNAMQHYAPPAPSHRPRKPKRLAMTLDPSTGLPPVSAAAAAVAAAPAVSYDLSGMFVDPAAYEAKPAKGGKKAAHQADVRYDDAVEAIFAKRTAEVQKTRTRLLGQPPADLFQLSRYGEFYAADSERSHLRGLTQKAIGFAQRIDFDEASLRPVTPKMRKLVEEEERRRQQRAREEDARRRERERLEAELAQAEQKPLVILQQRDRLQASVAKAALRHGHEGAALPPLAAAAAASPTQSPAAGAARKRPPAGASVAAAASAARAPPKLSDDDDDDDDDDDGSDEDGDRSDDGASRGAGALPAIARGGPPPFPLQKAASSLRGATAPAASAPAKLEAIAPAKKKAANVLIRRRPPGDAAEAAAAAAAPVWSGSRGVVGRRFDPDTPAPPAAAAPVSPAAGRATAAGAGATTSVAAGPPVSFQLGAPSSDAADSDAEGDSDGDGVEEGKAAEAEAEAQAVAGAGAGAATGGAGAAGDPTDAASLASLSQASGDEAAAERPPGDDVGVRAWVPSIATLIKRAKRVKFVKQPLPPAPRATFRGFAHQMPTNLVLTAAFAALLQLLLVNYGNRDWAFSHGLLPEVAEVALDCAAMPQLLEYFVELVETLCREGLGDATDRTQADDPDRVDDCDAQLDSASFLSAMVSDAGVARRPGGSVDGDEADGLVLDAVSEVSLPTVDPDVVWSHVHDQEAARLSDLGAVDGAGGQTAATRLPRGLAALREGDSDGDGDEADEAKRPQPAADWEAADAIVIQKITDADSPRSLAALAPGDDGGGGGGGGGGHVAGGRFPPPALAASSAPPVATGGRPSFMTHATANTQATPLTTQTSTSSAAPSGSAAPPPPRSLTASPAATLASSKRGCLSHASAAASSMPGGRSGRLSQRSTGSGAAKKDEAAESGYRLFVRSTLRDRIGRNRALVQSLGLSEFDARYRQTPEDPVITALSLTTHHVEVAPRTRELAAFWLEFWADGSREYKLLVLKGRNLCGL
jgi:hypothetical protein